MTLTQAELIEAWPLLSDEDRVAGFMLLDRDDAEDLFDQLDARQQSDLLCDVPATARRSWMRYLDPDDAADLIQSTDEEDRPALLDLLDPGTRREVNALLAYAEDEAGGLMSPRYARLRPNMSTDEAIAYLRRQTRRTAESIYYAYVLDPQQHMLGVVSLRELVTSPPQQAVSEVMETDFVSVVEGTDQEELGNLFAQHDLMAIPVLDDDRRMKGVVTVDDIVDVFREEATEDIHKIGGTEALDAPYLEVDFRELLIKRIGWLAGLLLLGVAAVLSLSYFEEQLQQATALALFVPLIIASGGNAGTQATTLVVRAMALEEVRLKDWARVIRREITVGIVLGGILGTLGVGIVFGWHLVGSAATGQPPFGPHYPILAGTIGISIVTVALWGTLAGSMLPFGLRALNLDPASSSAPLVATIVDATGLIIYFLIALYTLKGSML